MPLTPTFTPSIAPGNSLFEDSGDFTGSWTAPDNSGYAVSGSTSSATANTIFTFNGSDYLRGFDGNDSLYAGGGNDIVEGGDGDDTVSGDAGDDFLYGDYQYEASFATGDDFIFGGSGDDYLFGAGGNDELNGGADDDILEGGTGNDLLIGGSGADEFRFDLGAEVNTFDFVTDFVDGVDSLRFVDAGVNYTNIGAYDASLFNPSLDGTMIWATNVNSTSIDHYVYLENVDETLVTATVDASGDIMFA